jgi:quercetin dioxygenase-like cupin family protein
VSTIVRADQVPTVAEPGNDLTLQTLVTAAQHGPHLSVTRVQLDGHHRRLHTDRSTRVYAVLDGSITVLAGDGPAATVGAGDVAVVPAGEAYELTGTGTYLVINSPAFVDGDDVYEPHDVHDGPTP